MNDSIEFGMQNFGVALDSTLITPSYSSTHFHRCPRFLPTPKLPPAVTTRAKEVWSPLLDRRDQAERIRMALGMLERWKFFFNLPTSLQESVRRVGCALTPEEFTTVK